MRKVKIIRKRKPWLHTETKYLHNVNKGLCTLMDVFIRQPIVERQQAERLRVQNENREQDTRLKAMRECIAAEQARRLELLNAETRLKLENKYGKETVQEIMGEIAQGTTGFNPQGY